MAIPSSGSREIWGSQFGFVLAAAGSAIGLGNIWRFSYLAYENGGGAFLIPYLSALFIVAIPLVIMEFGIGHERIGSAPLAFARIRKRWEWLGWWAVIFVMFGIVLYYCVIISWCLNYLFYSVTLAWGNDPNTFFFQKFLNLSDGPGTVGTIQVPILVGLLVIWLLNWMIVYRGIRGGIELANKIFMPLLFVLMTVLVFWSLTLEGAGTGLRAYLVPDFSALARPKVWIDAFGQIFFSVSLGFGILIAYASYLPRNKANLTRNAVVMALMNSGFSIFAGLAVFSLLGYMAVQTQSPIEGVVTQSIGLAFVAYPKAISLLPGGAVFGVLFFASLVVAGLSSSISILEAFTSAIMDKFSLDRRWVVTTISVIGLLGGLVFTTQGGLFWLDIVDHFLTLYGLVVVGLLEALLVGWLFQIEILRKHINTVSSLHLGAWWSWLIRFVIPMVLIVLLGWSLKEELRPYADYSWSALLGIGGLWLLITILAALVFTWQPWKRPLDAPTQES